MKLGVQPAFRATDATGRISFFEQTGGSPVRLEMGAVNDHPAGRPALSRKISEDAVEDAHTRPANEPVVKRLVGSIGLRRIPPSQTISDNMDYPTDDTEVVHTRNPTRLRKVGAMRFSGVSVSLN